MRSITTGAGLAILGACVLGAAAISSSKGNQAMAQIGTERRVVNMGCCAAMSNYGADVIFTYRCWSDGTIEQRRTGSYDANYANWQPVTNSSWIVVENGQTPSVQPSDTNTDGSVDAADLGNVLLDYGAMQEVTPVPTIDCQTSTIP